MATHPSPPAFLRRDEAAALVLALAAHAGLIAWLALKPPSLAPLPVPERMTVTFADQIADQSTSPDPAAEAAPAIAPVIAPEPVPQPAPAPRPLPAPQVQPQPATPVARAIPAPMPRPAPPLPKPPVPASARPQPPKPIPKPAGGGGSRIGSDFLKGIAGGQTPGATAKAPPAAAIGPAVKSALAGAIARQLKPHWSAPQGADADQLVTVLSWDMNADGSLAGPPRVVSQSGITDANRAQAARHAEQAIRAVRLAAPFDLPADLYAAWQHVGSSRFDRKLSQ